MADREKIIKRLKKLTNDIVDGYIVEPKDAVHCVNDTLALLKEQEEQKRKWLQNIADNQLSIGGVDPLTEYEQGKWDGLQMAFEILTEERQH